MFTPFILQTRHYKIFITYFFTTQRLSIIDSCLLYWPVSFLSPFIYSYSGYFLINVRKARQLNITEHLKQERKWESLGHQSEVEQFFRLIRKWIQLPQKAEMRYLSDEQKIQKNDIKMKKDIETVIEPSKEVENSSACYNNQFKRKIGLFRMQKKESQCFICGNLSCKEATDHKKMSFLEFDQFLRDKAGYEPHIVKLKHKIGKCYQTLKKSSTIDLDPFVIDLFLMIDKLHFWHLLRFTNTLRDIEAAIFGIVLPKNKMIKIMHWLEQERDYNCRFPKFDKLLSEVHKLKKNIQKVIQNQLYDQLVFKLAAIIQECQDQYNRRRLQQSQCSWKSQTSETESDKQNRNPNGNPGMPSTKVQELIDSEIVLIQGVPFSTRRRNLDLSLLELTDANFFNCYSSLQKMKQVAELQLRNSRLSQRSYKMMLKQFPKLESLDLSNSNCQQMLPSMTKLVPNLKTLYLNETNLTNDNLIKITSELQNLRVLYADYNMLTTQCMEELFKKRKQLMYVSVKGNFIDEIAANRIQVNMVINGSYLQY